MNQSPNSPSQGRNLPSAPRPSQGRDVFDSIAHPVSDDDFLDDVLPDLGTDVGAEMAKVMERDEKPVEAPKPVPVVDTQTPENRPSGAPEARSGGIGGSSDARNGVSGDTPVKKGRGRPVSGLAYQGKTAVVPDRPVRETQERSSRIERWMEGYSPFQKDFHDLMDINAEIGMVSRAMMEVERIYGEFASYERTLAAEYEQAKSRALVDVSGSTEKTRTAYAEIMVEELRMNLDDVRLEVQRAERSQRMLARHLDALTVISNNLRAGFKVL